MTRILRFWVALLAIAAPTSWDRVEAQGAPSSMTVEFETIADPGALESIRVGYFRPGENVPIRTVEVIPAEVIVTGKVMRIAVPRLAIEGSGVVVLRLQVVSKTQGRSDWSEPTGRVTLPVTAAPERRVQGGRPPRPTLSAKELDAHPALKAEFVSRLGPDRSIDDALKAFRRVQDAATAVTLSRVHEIPLDGLCRLLIGPPAVSIAQAIRRLKPSLNPRQAIRDAQLEGRRLLSSSRPDQVR